MASWNSLVTRRRGWQCAQCQCRAFSVTRLRLDVGPEHPAYIEVPEPPQQNAPYRPFIKGRLPIPRDIFAEARGRNRASNEEIAKATRPRQRPVQHEPGSREEWGEKMSEMRRRNLREGIKGLESRKIATERRLAEETQRRQQESQELLDAPEREDERLNAPSHGLDLEKLMNGPLEDPNREARLAHKARNYHLHTAAKKADRLDHLHTLYMNARSFIVTPDQLDTAVEEAFGTPEKPVNFGGGGFYGSAEGSAASMWAQGAPSTIQNMLKSANKQVGNRALEGAANPAEINKERVRRIAEELTGGKMEDGSR